MAPRSVVSKSVRQVTFELSLHLLELFNDAYTTLNSDWLLNTQSRVLQADLVDIEKQ